jgi:hypothetical protein
MTERHMSEHGVVISGKKEINLSGYPSIEIRSIFSWPLRKLLNDTTR